MRDRTGGRENIFGKGSYLNDRQQRSHEPMKQQQIIKVCTFTYIVKYHLYPIILLAVCIHSTLNIHCFKNNIRTVIHNVQKK